MIKEDIIKFLYNKNNRLNANILKSRDPIITAIIDEIYSKTLFLREDVLFRTRVFCILNDITEVPVCPICKEKDTIDNKGNIRKFCSNKCVSIYANSKSNTEELNRQRAVKVSQTYHNKSDSEKLKINTKKGKSISDYRKNLRNDVVKFHDLTKKISDGVNIAYAKDPTIKDRISTTKKENYTNNKEYYSRIYSTNAKKYWETLSDDAYIERCEKNSKYYNSLSDEEKELVRLRKIDWYNNLTEEEKQKKANLISEKSKDWWASLSGEEVAYIIEKRQLTNSKKTKEELNAISKKKSLSQKSVWTNKTYKQKRLKSFSQKTYKTKKRNGTFTFSKVEVDLFDFLKNYYHDIKRQYKSDLYPFNCDYYIPSLDLYIELQATWTHGPHPFGCDKEDYSLIDEWRAKNSNYYNNAIVNWTERDVLKRATAKKNKLNFLEIFDFSDFNNILQQINRVISGLNLDYKEDILQKEFNKIKNSIGDINSKPVYNRIVKYFHTHFYGVENNIYKTDPFLRQKVITNRCRYLNKSECDLTDGEILRGFKISKVHYGYSFFNPLWIKYFIEKYNVNSIYDPCGGWGHRLLGAFNIKYIYNDIWRESYDGCCKIVDSFSIQNKKLYNEDATLFTPTEDYTAIFTCPPYANDELYFNEQGSYTIFLKCLFDKAIKDTVSIIGVVLSNKYRDILFEAIPVNFTLIEESIINKKSVNNFNKARKYEEYLYVFSKKQ